MKTGTFVLAGTLALLPTLAVADYCRDCSDHLHNLRHDHRWQPIAHAHHKAHKRERRKKHRAGHHNTASRQVEYARVVDVEPVYRYYTQTVEHDSCLCRNSHASDYRSWTPAILGAVIGGTVGHKIGDSYGDADVAAVAGGVLGAAIGRDVGQQRRDARTWTSAGPCRSVEHKRVRGEPVEYVVTYRYNGQVYRTHMDRHPGEWVELDVKIKPV